MGFARTRQVIREIRARAPIQSGMAILLVTGASGFLGGEIVRQAGARGHEVRALVRDAAGAARLGIAPEHIFLADLDRAGRGEDLGRANSSFAGADAVIHCAAITPERPADPELSRRVNVLALESLLRAAERAGRPRWIQISSMSASPRAESVYGKTKFEADEAVRASALPWTILRPSLIHGPGERGVAARTARALRRLPVLPIVGSGEELLRPVFVGDVAAAALACVERPAAIGKTYMIGGADEVALEEFMRRLARAAGAPRPAIRIPVPLALAIARLAEAFMKNPPLTVDNVLGVKLAERVDIGAARAELEFNPLGLEEGLRRAFPPAK